MAERTGKYFCVIVIGVLDIDGNFEFYFSFRCILLQKLTKYNYPTLLFSASGYNVSTLPMQIVSAGIE